ncbi:MAG: hypothetical protein P8N92_01430 [Burkholderiales bacterium]|nr:hypothetical protein [Burkholderiales bacterium]
MSLGAIVLARLDSSRLPGKSLTNVSGRPLLSYIVERLRKIPTFDSIVLATSDRGLDDELEDFARQSNIGCFRGSIDDVAGRVLKCAQAYNFDTFARVNGDSPLIDYILLAEAVRKQRESNVDIVTNIFPRSFPSGASVEVVRTLALEKSYRMMFDHTHFEHVTKFFYDNSSMFSILNFESGDAGLTSLNLAVDMPEDLERFQGLITAMTDGHLEYSGQRLYSLYRRLYFEEKCST